MLPSFVEILLFSAFGIRISLSDTPVTVALLHVIWLVSVREGLDCSSFYVDPSIPLLTRFKVSRIFLDTRSTLPDEDISLLSAILKRYPSRVGVRSIVSLYPPI